MIKAKLVESLEEMKEKECYIIDGNGLNLSCIDGNAYYFNSVLDDENIMNMGKDDLEDDIKNKAIYRVVLEN